MRTLAELRRSLEVPPVVWSSPGRLELRRSLEVPPVVWSSAFRRSGKASRLKPELQTFGRLEFRL